MNRHSLGPAVAVASLLMLTVPACSTDQVVQPQKAPQASTPPTPEMPAGWQVVEDHTFSGADLVPIEQKLGAKLSGLRNTTFEVGGTRVKVNTLVASDAAGAEALMAKIGATKPIEFLVQNRRYVYEFVCQNDAIPHARAGRQHLAGQ